MFFINKLLNPILWRPASEQLYQTILRFVEKNDTILEIGSGTGHISFMLAKKGFPVTMNEIRNDSLIQSLERFKEHHVPVEYVEGDCMKIKKHFDFIWNSGIVHCLWGAKREAFIKKVSQIGDTVLLFYPDTEGGTKEVYQNTKNIPGVDDAKEYPISDIPKKMKKYFKHVSYGYLSEKACGLPFKFVWALGTK